MPDLPEDDGTTKIGGTIIRDRSSTNEKEVFILSMILNYVVNIILISLLYFRII